MPASTARRDAEPATAAGDHPRGLGVRQHESLRPVAGRVGHGHRLRGQRHHRAHTRAAAGRALELHVPVKRPDPVLEPLQAGARAEGGSAPAVVGHRDRDPPVLSPHGDRRALRFGVLAHVGEAFGHDEVGGGLHGVRQPLLRRLEDLDRHGRARREVLQRHP